MTDLRTAAQQALEALEEYQSKGAPFWACDAAVTALRSALAQQEQEPVALFTKYGPPTMRDRDFWSAGYAAGAARAIEQACKERNT